MKNRLALVLGILLIGSAGYIAYDKYIDYRNNLIQNSFNQGVNYGSNQVIASIVNEVSQCKQFTIGGLNDSKINIIAVECLKNE